MYDVAYISNCLSAEHRATVMQLSKNTHQGYFDPMACTVLGARGAVYLIPSLPEDLLSSSGIKKARRHFMAATQAAYEQGVKVVLLAASLKRLFGADCRLKINREGDSDKNGKTLAEHFPSILFTNGDNGTSYFFRRDIDYVLSLVDKRHHALRYTVVGSGLLGMEAIQHLLSIGVPQENIQVVTRHPANIKLLLGEGGVQVVSESSDIDGDTDVIIICTHHASQRVSKEMLSRAQKPVYLLDVAVPYGFPENDHQFVQARNKNVYRQDGGNAYSPYIKFEFDPSLIGLHPKMFYGCFAEATALAIEIRKTQENEFSELDLFSVNQRSGKVIDHLLAKNHFSIPPVPRCFDVEISCHGVSKLTANGN